MRGRQKNLRIENYVKEHFSLFIFSVVLFIMGVVFGSFIIHSLSTTQKQEMISYLSQFFNDIEMYQQVNVHVAFKQLLLENIKYLALLWFLGLSIIGMPIIFILIFMKGFVVGFTISFLVSGLHWKGFIFSLVSVIPQNLIIVPVYIIAGVVGTLFSLSLLRGRRTKRTDNSQPSFLSYSVFMLALGGLLIIAAGFETYISPYLMKSVSSLLIQS